MRNVRALLVLVVCVAVALAVRAWVDDDARSTAPTPQVSGAPTLRVTVLKDGDSWVASDGREYRLGLIDAPEPGQPCHDEATRFTRAFLSDGFTVDAYSSDPHGRQVAEVFDRSGRSLNVALAASGLAAGTYLESFRHENPNLAHRIERALDTAADPPCRNGQPAGTQR